MYNRKSEILYCKCQHDIFERKIKYIGQLILHLSKQSRLTKCKIYQNMLNKMQSD